MLLVMTACGGSVTSPSDKSTITATIDGASWSAASVVVTPVMNISGVIVAYNVVGTNQTQTILQFTLPASTGTFPVGTGPSEARSIGFLQAGATQGWTSSSGQVAVASYSADRASGTFSYAMAPFTGAATGNRTVANGQFNLRLR